MRTSTWCCQCETGYQPDISAICLLAFMVRLNQFVDVKPLATPCGELISQFVRQPNVLSAVANDCVDCLKSF